MKLWLICFYLILATAIHAQPSRHVVLLSIDGWRNDMYLDRSWPAPNLQQLMTKGTYADHLKSVFPSYTYPSHTAMLTGALPARSGIYFNQPKNSHGEWNWFMDAIKVPTLWQALKKIGMTTAAVEWPVSVGPDITWDIPEIWDPEHPGDRITAARKYATPGLIDEVERSSTGSLDSVTMNEDYLSLDEQSARIAGYIFRTYKPAFMAVHFACIDGEEHAFGREGDSVRLAVACVDHAVGDVLEAIQRSGLADSTTIIIVGDHGFSTYHSVFRPNILIQDLPARFVASGGSAFLYRLTGKQKSDEPALIATVTRKLDSLPSGKRKLFRIINRPELDQMGADSSALIALAATPGLVFSGSTKASQPTNLGPGTAIQQNLFDGLFIEAHGGHHGYDPDNPEMYTGFIAIGAGIIKGGKINEISEPDIAPLIAKLLGIDFPCPDGRFVLGILDRD